MSLNWTNQEHNPTTLNIPFIPCQEFRKDNLVKQKATGTSRMTTLYPNRQ